MPELAGVEPGAGAEAAEVTEPVGVVRHQDHRRTVDGPPAGLVELEVERRRRRGPSAPGSISVTVCTLASR